jgi:hypothetical protein
MKIRMGFVANSSSTSFAIIGTDNDSVIYDLLETIEGVTAGIEDWLEDLDYGHGELYSQDADIRYYGSSEEMYYVGIPAEILLETMTIPQAIKYFKNYINDNYGIDIPIGEIKFITEECSSD